MFGTSIEQQIARADLLFAQGMVLTAGSSVGAACSLFDECVSIRRKTLGLHLATARALYWQALSRDGKEPEETTQMNALLQALLVFRHDDGIRHNADLEFDVVARRAIVLEEIDFIMSRRNPVLGASDECPEVFGLFRSALRKLGMRSDEGAFATIVCRRELLRRDLDEAILTLASWFGERSMEVAEACITRANIDFATPFRESRDRFLKWQMVQNLLRALEIKTTCIGRNSREVAALNRKVGSAFEQMQMPAAANAHHREATRIELFNAGFLI